VSMTKVLRRAGCGKSAFGNLAIGVYPCSSAAKLPFPRTKLALLDRKDNYGYYQSDTG